MTEAIERARRGDGPTFLEMKTYRYRGHSMSDAQLYRSKDEVEEYKKIDPITQVLDLIKDQKYATEEEITAIEKRVKEYKNALILLKNLITLRCNNYMM
jgi:pyruvate dehydrogenase E1 component alpha subunit